MAKPPNPRIKNPTESLLMAGVCETISATLSPSTGMDETRLLERAKAFFDIYIRQIVENRRLHNDMFEGWVGEDFQFCIDRYQFMDELGKRISGQGK